MHHDARGTSPSVSVALVFLKAIATLTVSGLALSLADRDTGRQDVQYDHEGRLGEDCSEAGQEASVAAMQKCVETLQKYAESAQDHAQRSKTANTKYAQNFHSAMLLVKRLEGERAKHEEMFKDVSAEQKKTFDGLFERLGAVSGTLESLTDGQKQKDGAASNLNQMVEERSEPAVARRQSSWHHSDTAVPKRREHDERSSPAQQVLEDEKTTAPLSGSLHERASHQLQQLFATSQEAALAPPDSQINDAEMDTEAGFTVEDDLDD